jgi:ribA/ribD-fused uncharacterized protein
MSTPITVKKREEAIAKKIEQRKRQQNFVPDLKIQQQIQRLPSARQQNIDYSQDVLINNFDWDDWTTSPRAALTSPPQLAVAELQNIIYKNVIIDKDNLFIFHGKDSCMSTFYEIPFKLSNHTYPNVETYYEACKLFCLIHPSCSPLVQKAKYAAGAKKIASEMMKKHNIPRKVINAWKLREGAQAVYNATFAKFDQNSELKKKLLETGDKMIVHCYEKDNIFGCGCTEKELQEWFEKNDSKVIKVPVGVQIHSDKAPKIGKGLNLLGYFCMAIREQLRQTEANLEALQTLSLL